MLLSRRYHSKCSMHCILLTVMASFIFIFSQPKTAFCSVSDNQQAPNFSLQGLDHNTHSLAKYSGKTVVLFFFCGCKWCHDAARNWALAQRKYGSVLHERTVIVYSGGANEAREFVKQTGLDTAQSDMLIDDGMAVTYFKYNAVPCPRVYVLSPSQSVVYTNDHRNDAPRTITGQALIQNVVNEIESISTKAAGTAAPGVGVEAPAIPSVFLTPIDGNGVKVVGSGQDRQAAYDFGTVKQSVTKTIEHVFQFRNDTSSTILIDHIQPSCGCTNAFIGNSTDFPVSVNAGATVNVTAYVDLTDLYPSSVEKSVMIFRAGQIQPLAIIEITGNLVSGT